jgi:formylglycine-generating enzyme required for sulfatase activity
MNPDVNQKISTINNQMIALPGGTIELRDDRIKQKWSVELKPFSLSKYPVTQVQYHQVTQQSPSTFKGDNNPVESITWKESVLFCNKLSDFAGLQSCYVFGLNDSIGFMSEANGYRLPTEAEWEYACKAGSNAPRYGPLESTAWYKNNSDRSTHKVGLKQPNAWGFYDMLGNVWEWCNDIYDETVYGSYRIIRGGGWCDDERGVLATNRRRSHPTSFKIDDLGFRIAKNKS